jgi:hypothetical protein
MKFKSILSRSGQGLLNARATNIANIVKAEQEQVIATYKREAQRLINELTNLMDLSINNTTSLSPVDKDFNPKQFVETIHTKKSGLRDALVDWKIAVETYNEWFPEDAVTLPKELGNVVGLGIILMDEESDDKEIEK